VATLFVDIAEFGVCSEGGVAHAGGGLVVARSLLLVGVVIEESLATTSPEEEDKSSDERNTGKGTDRNAGNGAGAQRCGSSGRGGAAVAARAADCDDTRSGSPRDVLSYTDGQDSGLVVGCEVTS
jgi:hypothetical protein